MARESSNRRLVRSMRRSLRRLPLRSSKQQLRDRKKEVRESERAQKGRTLLPGALKGR